MYFTNDSAFVNYLEHFPNLTESLDYLIIKNKTTFEQTPPISFNVSKFEQVKEVGAVTQKEITQKEINSECKIITYISLALTILGLMMVAILHYKKSKWCRGCLFSNAVKIMIFISDVQYYIPVKL